MDNINYELVSPEKLLAQGQAKLITLPATEGNMGVMINHAATMTSLRPGLMCIEQGDGKQTNFFIKGGFADISAKKITVLAEFAVAEAEMTDEMRAGV